MNDTARVTSFDQLGSLKSKIDVIPTSQEPIPEQTRFEKKPKFQPRPTAGAPVNNPNFQPKPKVDEIVNVIKTRTQPVRHDRNELPTLEGFIMLLQEHTFSFTMSHATQLPKFVAAQRRERTLHDIAWSGGDEYMTALMLYQEMAVKAINEKAIRMHLAIMKNNEKMRQQRDERNLRNAANAGVEESAAEPQNPDQAPVEVSGESNVG